MYSETFTRLCRRGHVARRPRARVAPQPYHHTDMCPIVRVVVLRFVVRLVFAGQRLVVEVWVRTAGTGESRMFLVAPLLPSRGVGHPQRKEAEVSATGVSRRRINTKAAGLRRTPDQRTQEPVHADALAQTRAAVDAQYAGGIEYEARAPGVS